ncbi:hypothetical protein [Aliiroseovarius marinus]
MLIRLIKLLFFLGLLAGIGLTGYAYLGDMSPRVAPQSTTVTLNGG